MPKIIKNNIVYGSGAKYVELTQLQYDQLTDAEKHNGKMYFITDTNGDGSDFQPIIYSESERAVGVYIDGKPLYRKDYLYGQNTFPSQSTKIVIDSNFSSLNVEKLVKVDGCYKVHHIASNFDITLVIAFMNIQYRTDNGTLDFYQTFTGNYSQYNNLVVSMSVYYTKTTDTAGSGTWTPQGIPARHYSSDEQVIGTWIDGSTMYSKTITIYPITKDGADHYVNHNISNVNLMLGYEAFFSKSSNGRCCDKNTDTNTQYVCSVFEANRTQIGYAIGSGWDFDYCYVTLKYNKTV